MVVRIRGPLAVMTTVCSKWADRLAIRRNHGPFVCQRLGSWAANGDHRLDGQGHSLEQTRSPFGGTVIGHLGLLVKPGPDPVAHQLPHHAIPCSFRYPLHRVPDVSHMITEPGLGDAGSEGFLGHP